MMEVIQMPRPKNCFTCEWFREHTEPLDPLRYGIGFCQRYPPVYQKPEMATPDHRFPTIIEPGYYCGEFSRK